MNEAITALVELQSIDDEILEHKQQRDALAGNLDRLQSILSRMGDELADKRERLAEARRFHEDKRLELEGDSSRMTTAKKKLAAVTRTKEYAAMQREVDGLRKKFTDDEAELKRLAEAIADYTSAIAVEEGRLAELEEEVARERGANADRIGRLDTLIAEISKRKVGLIARLPKGLVGRYDRLLDRREGKAVVPVAGGRCQGCRMVLPPQLYIMVQRGEKLESCPSCQRFVYYTAEIAAALAT